MGRKTKGRQKVEMVKMTNSSNLQVTFSKRRFGLFKKASELSTLCGVDIAAVVSSPGGKIFSFGSPSVESVIDRFLDNKMSDQLLAAHRNLVVSELNSQLNQVETDVDVEKNRKKELEKLQNARQNMCWWENPIDHMSSEQLAQLRPSLLGLKNNVTTEIEKARLQMNYFQSIHGASSSHGCGDGGIRFVQNIDGASSSHGREGGAILSFVQDSDGASSSQVPGVGGILPYDRTSAMFNSNVMFGYGPQAPMYGRGN